MKLYQTYKQENPQSWSLVCPTGLGFFLYQNLKIMMQHNSLINNENYIIIEVGKTW